MVRIASARPAVKRDTYAGELCVEYTADRGPYTAG